MKTEEILKRNKAHPPADEGESYKNYQLYRLYKFFLLFFVIFWVAYGYIKKVNTYFLIPLITAYWVLQCASLYLSTRKKVYIIGIVILLPATILGFIAWLPSLLGGL